MNIIPESRSFDTLPDDQDGLLKLLPDRYPVRRGRETFYIRTEQLSDQELLANVHRLQLGNERKRAHAFVLLAYMNARRQQGLEVAQ